MSTMLGSSTIREYITYAHRYTKAFLNIKLAVDTIIPTIVIHFIYCHLIIRHITIRYHMISFTSSDIVNSYPK
jgi:hypothetical protein